MSTHLLRNESGFSMVATMLALSLLALFGMVAASIAVNEQRTSFNELVHSNSMMAADSGTEAGSAWLLTLDNAPKDNGSGTYVVKDEQNGSFVNHAGQSFSFTIQHMEDPLNPGKRWSRPRPGYTIDGFSDQIYAVDSDGEAGVEGRGSVSVIAHRLFRDATSGY